MSRPLHFGAKGLLLSLLGLRPYQAILSLGYGLILGMPPRRRRLGDNLRRIRSFNGLPTPRAEIRRHARRLAELHAEIQASLALFAIDSDPAILGEVQLPLLSALRRLRRAGRGVILAAPHYGNLWVCAKALDRARMPLACILNAPSPYRWGQTPGLRVLGRKGSARASWRFLSQNGCVLVTADMDFGAQELRLPFFGAAFPAPRDVARLSRLSGAPVLPVCAVKRAGRLSLECGAAIDPGRATIPAIAGRLLRAMEGFIGSDPSQWLLLSEAWGRPSR